MTFKVTATGMKEIGHLPGVRSNGQHLQLPGHVIVEYRPNEDEFWFFHPDTPPTTGHIDVRYRPSRRNGPGVSIERYQHRLEINFTDTREVEHLWPSGGWHLLRTIIKAEEHMFEMVGLKPKLADHLVSSFRHTTDTAPRAATAVA